MFAENASFVIGTWVFEFYLVNKEYQIKELI